MQASPESLLIWGHLSRPSQKSVRTSTRSRLEIPCIYLRVSGRKQAVWRRSIRPTSRYSLQESP